MFNKTLSTTLAAAALCVAGPSNAGLAPFFDNFEDITPAGAPGDDVNALADYSIFANVFNFDKTAFLFSYGVFPAPNGTGGFSNVTEAGTGAPLGNRGIVTFSDYNNVASHANGDRVETNFFREQIIDAGDVGSLWQFSFIAAPGDLSGASLAQGFIKVLDPNNGFSLSDFLTVDTTTLPSGNTKFKITTDIRADQVGHILQFGFLTEASGFEPSGVNYDNLGFRLVPTPSAAMGSLGLLALAARRRRA